MGVQNLISVQGTFCVLNFYLEAFWGDLKLLMVKKTPNLIYTADMDHLFNYSFICFLYTWKLGKLVEWRLVLEHIYDSFYSSLTHLSFYVMFSYVCTLVCVWHFLTLIDTCCQEFLLPQAVISDQKLLNLLS